LGVDNLLKKKMDKQIDDVEMDTRVVFVMNRIHDYIEMKLKEENLDRGLFFLETQDFEINTNWHDPTFHLLEKECKKHHLYLNDFNDHKETSKENPYHCSCQGKRGKFIVVIFDFDDPRHGAVQKDPLSITTIGQQLANLRQSWISRPDHPIVQNTMESLVRKVKYQMQQTKSKTVTLDGHHVPYLCDIQGHYMVDVIKTECKKKHMILEMTVIEICDCQKDCDVVEIKAMTVTFET